MKFTVATAAVVSSSISATTAEVFEDLSGRVFHDAVEDTERARHRNLADAVERQKEITTKFRERRLAKKKNGGIAHRIQSKIKNSVLRNKAKEGGDMSAQHEDLDLGVFDRELQMNLNITEQLNTTQPEEETVIDQLLALCENGNPEFGLTCACTNVNETNYSIDVFCSYDQNTCYPAENSCGEMESFCYLETYDLELTAPGTGSSKICYDVFSPIKMTYCYELIYDGFQSEASSCAMEFDGTQCNSCEFESDETCNSFDCANIDNGVGTGSVCGNETVWRPQIEEHLLYAPLPCEGGCTLCPGGGYMTTVDNTVILETEGVEETYFCFQLKLAAGFGYLQYVPGNLCETLPALVNEPCGCMGGDPVDVTIELGPADSPSRTKGSSSASSAAISSITGGVAITAAATSIVSWIMA